MSTLELAPGETAFVGRDGQTLKTIEWACHREDREYRVVDRTEHLDTIVQTQWEGVADTVEIGFMYVTGIRWANEWTTVWHSHWPCTDAEAKAKHEEIVALLRETCPELPTWQTRPEFQRRLRRTGS
ncbi:MULTISPECIES: hypothetical protein [unclassified Streptomyces]|uniref:hypothetical protein n=1 Tax=unclassified Streptomyces TaxID=2593676 RepID=UPI002E2A2F30|nr:hypothetical protein [Streptomyces sp. NBC_00285]